MGREMRAGLQGGCPEEVGLIASRKGKSLCRGLQVERQLESWALMRGQQGKLRNMAGGSGQGPWFCPQ